MLISKFDNCYQTRPSKDITIETTLKSIGDSQHNRRHLIHQIRQCDDKTTQSELKSNLEAVTFSGTFFVRNKGSCTKYNGTVVLDFDDIEDAEFTKSLAEAEPTTMAVFISPNGKGLKVLVPTNNEMCEHHSVAWLRVANFYADVLGEQIDQSGKDVSRLCYMSYDPTYYYNPDATPYDVGEIRASDVADFQEASNPNPEGGTIKGDRHNYLLSMSLRMANAGCNASVIRSAVMTTIQEQMDLSDGRTFDQTELDNIINSAIAKSDGKELAVVEAAGTRILETLQQTEAEKEDNYDKLYRQLDELDDDLQEAINGSVEIMDLDFHSGLGKELQELWHGRAKRYKKDMDILGIITLAASLMGSAYRTVNDVTPQLYVANIGPSGSGKGHNYEMISLCMEQCDKYIPCDEVSAGTAIATQLQEMQSQLLCLDEFHQKLGAATSNTGLGGNAQELLTFMTRIWGVTGKRQLKTFSDSKKNIRCMDPALSCLISSTPDAMRPYITGPMLTNGFMGRILFYNDMEDGERSNNVEFPDFPEDLQSIIAQYCNVNKPNETEVALNSGFKPYRVAYTSDANKVMLDFRDKIEKVRQVILNPQDTKHRLAVLVERVHQMASKIALVWAWLEHAPPSTDKAYAMQFYNQRFTPKGFSITERHARIGCFMAMRSLGQLLSYVGDVFGDSNFQRNLTMFMQMIRTRGSVGIPVPQLHRAFAQRQGDFEEYVRVLQAMGKIHMDETKGIPYVVDSRAHRKEGKTRPAALRLAHSQSP